MSKVFATISMFLVTLSFLVTGCGDDAQNGQSEIPLSDMNLTGTWSGTAAIDGSPGNELNIMISVDPEGIIHFTALHSRGHYDCQASDVRLSEELLSFVIVDGDLDSTSVSLTAGQDTLSGRWLYTTISPSLGGDMQLVRTSADPLAPEELFALDAFVPADFEIPPVLETDRFRLRMLTVEDVEMDYDAVMSSAEDLRRMSGGWPAEDMTVEDNLHDLQRHQADFERRESFTYTVVNLDEDSVLGCLYINPPWEPDGEFDAVVTMWVRSSEMDSGLDTLLFSAVDTWLAESWSFEKVYYYGGD